MRRVVILAGVLCVVVLGLYGVMLVNAVPPTDAGVAGATRDAQPGPFVPPLERLLQAREAATGELVNVSYHTMLEAPSNKVFQTLYKGGTQIVFNHHEHVDGYGLACIQCHHVERCSRCHIQGSVRQMDVSTGKQALHENCIGCHADLGGPSKCDECHKQ